jgi:ABC-type transport system involved in multi-copper enzyme maturation permease subunit
MVLVAIVLGAVFLLLFGIGYRLVVTGNAPTGAGALGSAETQIIYSLLTIGGLYVVHFLAIMLAIVATVGAVSGEISSHTIQSIVTKPLSRWQVIAGKWIGYTVMLALYTGLLCVGILLESAAFAGYVPPNVVPGVALIVMQTAVLVSLSLLCGVYVSTLTNGVILFMLYGLAFIGSWVEQIGTLFHSSATEQIGVISSLLLPVEALWRLSAFNMQPSLLDNLNVSPFSLGTAPSTAMIIYAGVYVLGLSLLAMRAFARRDL